MRKSAIKSIAAASTLIIASGTVWLSVGGARGGIGFEPRAVSPAGITQQTIQPSQRVLMWDTIKKRCLPDQPDNRHTCTLTGYYAVEPGHVTWGQLDEELTRKSFQVYTATEINALLGQTINSITVNGGLIDQRIGAAEARMNTQIANTVSNLPQNLLTEEARRQIREQVTTDIRSDLDQLRSVVQALRDDVDDLKRQRQRRR